jgi:hypothetical protein
MIETLSHPAQSTEFLSRLHDGELPPPEAAAFEAHRRECEECRTAVAEFETALQAYRAAPVTPHASDLSARILRKIRATTPARRPFGVTFGIDLRWAGVLAAALLVVIIGAPVFSRKAPTIPPAPQNESASARSGSAPIPAYVVDEEAPQAAEKKANIPPSLGAQSSARAPKTVAPAAPAAPAVAESRENAAGFAAAKPEAPAAVAQSRRDESRPVEADDVKAKPEPAPPAELDAAAPSAGASASKEVGGVLADRRRSAAAPQGGEAGGGPEEPVVAVKLLIHPADGEGAPPDLARTPADERLAGLRGRTFLLLVEGNGRIRSVEERTPHRNKLEKDKARESDDLEGARTRSAEESALREIVFQPSDRSRRLLVTVQ